MASSLGSLASIRPSALVSCFKTSFISCCISSHLLIVLVNHIRSFQFVCVWFLVYRGFARLASFFVPLPLPLLPCVAGGKGDNSLTSDDCSFGRLSTVYRYVTFMFLFLIVLVNSVNSRLALCLSLAEALHDGDDF